MTALRRRTPDPHGLGVPVRAGAVVVAVIATLLAVLTSPTGPAVAATPTAAASTDVQERVDAAFEAYAASRLLVQGLSAQVERLTDNAEQAEATAADLREEVAEDDGGLLDTIGDFFGGDSAVDRAAEAAENAADARELADQAEAALDEAITATEQDRLRWEAAQQRLARIEATWSATEVIEAAILRSQPADGYAVADPAQDRRNRQALRGWVGYLRQVARAGVVPPTADDLADPADLAPGLEPMQVAGFPAVAGVAAARLPDGRPVTVLPAETIRAVSDAFHRLGLTEVPGGIAPSTYACGGLVANAWGATRMVLPADTRDQVTDLPGVAGALTQVGDVVALGGRRTGLGETAVYVGAGLAIAADPVTGTAAVRSVAPRDVLATRRPSLMGDGLAVPADEAVDVPAFGVCGGDADAAAAASGGPLALPVAAGSYGLTAEFGQLGARWSSGEHTGLDFAAATGTPVTASAAGTVTVEAQDWAGSLVRIDHGGGVETWYAHLSRVDVTTGQTVESGDPVGAVGARGNASGPHLHFEVRLDGTAYDPALALELPEAPQPTYPNGEMPPEALCPATADGVHQLRCDAAVAFRLLSAAYATTFGTDLCLTDSYRSREAQEQLFGTKPGLAATPGTSVHGLGRAVDLCGGVERFETAEHEWVVAHGPALGWVHPAWAAAGGGRPEPWHFEYAGANG